MLSDIKCVFRISLQLLSETFLILRRSERNMIQNICWSSCTRGADKSLSRSASKQARSMSGTRAISTSSRCELSSSFFPPLHGKASKVIHAILTETLACFLPVRAMDLSAPLYGARLSTGFICLIIRSTAGLRKQGDGVSEQVHHHHCFLPGRAKDLSAPL